MQIRRIMLTGDDGYNSTGTRLLIHLLRDKYDLTVVGTRTQQSAVGGKISLASGFDWCETEVDGIPALCVDGTPGDATELAAAYFKQPFDLAISGLNWGANLGSSVFGSGTVNAALRALSVNVAPKAIALSWDLPPKFYVMHHHESEDIKPFLEYPGKALLQLLEFIFAQKMWQADLLNINFPHTATNKVKFTTPILNAQDVYDYALYQVERGQPDQKQHFTYTNQRKYVQTLAKSNDAKALTDQYISITPCKYDILENAIYQRHQNLEFEL